MACKTCHNNTDELKASVNRVWQSTRKSFVRKVCKSFKPRLERVIAVKSGHIESFDVFGSHYIAMLQKLFNFTTNYVTIGV